MTHRRTLGFRAFLFTVLLTAMGSLTASAARDATVDPDDREYLRRQYAWFQSLPTARQQQLRVLNDEFHQLDPDTQTRLVRVMQNYNAWLAKLPDNDRQRVLQAETSGERLRIVTELRERDWVRTLPKVQRDEYAHLPVESRAARVREWRSEEDSRHDEWSIAQRNWEDVKLGKVPAGFAAEPRAHLEAFVTNLRPSLTEWDRKALDDARTAADENGQFMWYAIEVVRLADTHPLLPGRVGAKDILSLSEANRDYLTKNDRAIMRKKGPAGMINDDAKDLKRASGKWPEFALELAKHCEKHNLKLPQPIGDCTKEHMPPEVKTFLEKTLEPLLRKTPKGPEQLEALNRASGKWPEYPKMVMDLAKFYRLPIPNWTLPGPPQSWDRFRVSKLKPK
ncbi:hypothetical protein [Zavarzinella formosa]|uniref:hypothetical protein n=1 Tax=Zavarzinella formosa TaxID=360055 RepID=UPI0012F7B824|nr:hypothetical protein [Zavarzinella formosa]